MDYLPFARDGLKCGEWPRLIFKSVIFCCCADIDVDFEFEALDEWLDLESQRFAPFADDDELDFEPPFDARHEMPESTTVVLL